MANPYSQVRSLLGPELSSRESDSALDTLLRVGESLDANSSSNPDPFGEVLSRLVSAAGETQFVTKLRGLFAEHAPRVRAHNAANDAPPPSFQN